MSGGEKAPSAFSSHVRCAGADSVRCFIKSYETSACRGYLDQHPLFFVWQTSQKYSYLIRKMHIVGTTGFHAAVPLLSVWIQQQIRPGWLILKSNMAGQRPHQLAVLPDSSGASQLGGFFLCPSQGWISG